MMAQTKAASGLALHRSGALAALALAGGLLTAPAMAQNFPITPAMRATAEQVANAGVPLSELAPNAPDSYVVKKADTLWAISGMFLKTPWRWPELWGMNLEEIRNPHLIYPGQTLVLDKTNGRATLRLQAEADGTVRVSPRTRFESLADAALPTLQSGLIEPFLSESIIVDERMLGRAPRIVAAPDTRVLITRGDRAYARGLAEAPLLLNPNSRTDEIYRVFRNAKPLRDPVTNAILGYEAQFIGRAALVRSETAQPVKTSSGSDRTLPVAATIDIVSAREEMRVGDRLLPEPPRQPMNYVPRAPGMPVDGTIISIHGDAVTVAGQYKVVVINKGTADGVESGHVMAILKTGEQIIDKSQPGQRDLVKIPDEKNGLMMVFRPFEKLSYALILEITDAVKIGDRVTNPR